MLILKTIDKRVTCTQVVEAIAGSGSWSLVASCSLLAEHHAHALHKPPAPLPPLHQACTLVPVNIFLSERELRESRVCHLLTCEATLGDDLDLG